MSTVKCNVFSLPVFWNVFLEENGFYYFSLNVLINQEEETGSNTNILSSLSKLLLFFLNL